MTPAASRPKRSTSPRDGKRPRKWLSSVTTVSTFPPAGLFTRDASTVARVLASRRVSPKGLGSGIRMLQFFINRSGKNLSPARRRELERAKQLMQERAERGRNGRGQGTAAARRRSSPVA
jgi:tRNA(adenine34) deaminase